MGVTARTKRDDMTHDTMLSCGASTVVTMDDVAEGLALLRRMPRGEPTAGHDG
jgi:hypothetical protein